MPSKLSRRKVVQAKLETTAGTKITLASADSLFTFDPTFNADIDVSTRLASGTLGEIQGVSDVRKASGSFKVELAGKGAIGLPTWASLVLPAAGFKATSQTYAPISDASQHKTFTYTIFEDGLAKTAYGCPRCIDGGCDSCEGRGYLIVESCARKQVTNDIWRLSLPHPEVSRYRRGSRVKVSEGGKDRRHQQRARAAKRSPESSRQSDCHCRSDGQNRYGE